MSSIVLFNLLNTYCYKINLKLIDCYLVLLFIIIITSSNLSLLYYSFYLNLFLHCFNQLMNVCFNNSSYASLNAITLNFLISFLLLLDFMEDLFLKIIVIHHLQYFHLFLQKLYFVYLCFFKELLLINLQQD